MNAIQLKALAFVLVFYLHFSGMQTYAQQGNPYLTHFKLPSGYSNQNWGFDQGENGLMYILNRKGIFSFDGLEWENLGVSGRPIAIAYSNHLFFSSDRGIGYFTPNSEGSLDQKMILQTTGSNIFYKFNRISGGLLVVSPQTICRISTDDNVRIDTLYHETRREVFISDFFQLNGQMYHVKNRSLIYLNKPNGGYEMLAGLPLGEDMVFSFIHDDIAYFGSTANRLYRFDGKKFMPFPLKDQDYVSVSVLNGGISVNKHVFALSTSNGGVLLVNSADGSTLNTLNFYTGLPDDEIFSLGLDTDGGLWMSHGMGITRADLLLPVKSFGYYQGLRGSILSCLEFNGSIYVGCSEGLFLLTETRDYKAFDVIVKGQKQAKPKRVDAKSVSPQPQEQETVEEKKKSFLSRFFSRHGAKDSDDDAALRAAEQARTAADEAEPHTVRRRIYELQSVSHTYKPVKGIQGKVRQLIEHQGLLFAATNFGLFEVKGEVASRIIGNKNIVFVESDRFDEDVLLIGTDEGAYLAKKRRGRWVLTNLLRIDNQLIVSMAPTGNGNYLVSSEFDVFFVSIDENNQFMSKIIPVPENEFGTPMVRLVNNRIAVYTHANSFVFDSESHQLLADSSIKTSPFTASFFQEGYTWINHRNNWICLAADESDWAGDSHFLSLLDNPTNIRISNGGTLLVVNDYNEIFKISTGHIGATERPISLFLKKVTGKYGIQLDPGDIELGFSSNSLSIKISAPSYLKEGGVRFQYLITGLTDSWSEWTADPTLEFPYFPPGNYTISIRAMDILGNFSNKLDIPFHIKPPFWRTLWFYTICFFMLIIFFVLIVKVRERSLKREKEILEQKVKERTKTIEEQKETLKKQRDDLAKYNEEILQQKEEIEAQRDEIEIQRDQIFKQNDEITKSITYARRIQSAVMPSLEVAECMLKNHFMIFRPRDIVSGDFHWMAKHNGKTIVVASDCTGHGIPGAFMSMMGISFLNDIVNVAGVTQPDLILNELREKIKANFRQTTSNSETRDGMDIAVCAFDDKERMVQYAGAYNPLYLIRNGELIEYKADKMPVGAHIKEVEFTLHEISLMPGDNVYIFSDGYVDQFGGSDGKKFMAKPFKELLKTISGKPLQEQKQLLENSLDRWQAAYDQVDDILVIGIAIV